MKNFGRFFVLVLTITLLSFFVLNAQVPANSFGIVANFNSNRAYASCLYTFSPKIEVGLGLGASNSTYTVPEGQTKPNPKLSLAVHSYVVYYLLKADINPYIGITVDYSATQKDVIDKIETSRNTIGTSLIFGGEAFITKSVAIFTEIGLDYTIENLTQKVDGADKKYSTSTLSLMTGSIGAAFYFN